MHKLKSIAVASVILVSLAVPRLAGGETVKRNGFVFDIAFGLIDPSSGGVQISKETLRIPRMSRESGFRYGLVIAELNRSRFKAQLVHYLPAQPKTLSGSLARKDPTSAATKGVAGPARRYDGRASWFFVFDEGDPIGIYRLEIVVDGGLLKTIEYEVVPPHESVRP